MKVTRRSKRAARQLFRLCVVDGQLNDERIRQVARGLAASTRRGALAVLAAFQRLVRLDRHQHSALVESATALTDDVRQDVEAGLARLYGAGLETTFEQTPRLIGGMRIRVGSDVYDGSIRARLAALESRL